MNYSLAKAAKWGKMRVNYINPKMQKARKHYVLQAFAKD
jgi:hypothetical protein